MSEETPTILSVKNLRTHFATDGGVVKAVDGVSFDVKKGETLGIVGESGSGKSVTAMSLMRLIRADCKGSVIFDGRELLDLSAREMRKVRGRRVAMVLQDPFASLNPFLKISKQLTEVTRLHLGHSRAEARRHASEMLEAVGIPDAAERMDNYPHEFSGGMRQRVMIAMALSCNPELLIADEPTTALDVTIQAQIIELIKELTRGRGTTVILITHDLGVVAGLTDKVVVMYAGHIFEQAPTRELFSRPANPYTIGLLKSVPNPESETGRELYQIPGLPPDMSDLLPGCPFAPRCYRAEEICRDEFPPMIEIDVDHRSLCHFAKDVYTESKNEPRMNADDTGKIFAGFK